MRINPLTLCMGLLAAGVFHCLGAPAVATAQWSFDARRLSMVGGFVARSSIRDQNPAYRAVPIRRGAPKFSIPIPLGLFQLAKDVEVFSTDANQSENDLNVFKAVNFLLQPPIFLELREPPVPDETTNIEIFVGLDSLLLDLGSARDAIPQDNFTMGTSSRFLDVGIGFSGLRVGVSAFSHTEIAIRLSDELRGVLRDGEAVENSTRYPMFASGIGQTGVAPSIGYAFRVPGTGGAGPVDASDVDDAGLYLGATVRYYVGLGLASADGELALVTSDPIFNTVTPADVEFQTDVFHEDPRDGIGTGLGFDVGIALIQGPFELGLGLSDVGTTTIRWKNATQRFFLLNTSNEVIDSVAAERVEFKGVIPMTYFANAGVRFDSFRLGASFESGAGGEELKLAAEKWVGVLALRGGVGIDKRGKPTVGAGTGIRFGPLGLDVGVFTHSSSISGHTGVRLASSIAVY